MIPAAPRPRPTIPVLLAFALAVWVCFSFGFTPLRTSHDEFWHLKTGQWIDAHGYLPVHEIFTYTAGAIPWHNHEWLTQWAMWKVYQAGEASGWGGWPLVILMKTLFIVAAFAGFGMLLARRMHRPELAALAVALCAALGRRTFYPRPPYVTYLLLAAVLAILLAWRGGRLRRRWLWSLPPLFALWANLHGGWMAGLLVVGAFWADAVWGVLAAWTGRRPAGRAWERVRAMTLLCAGCLAGSLLNPYGYQLYLLPGTVMQDAYLAASIGEMLPPLWAHVWVLAGVIALAALTALRPVTARGMGGACLAVAGLVMALLALSDVRGLTLGPGTLPLPGAHHAWGQAALALPVLGWAAWRTRRPGRIALVLLALFFGLQGLLHVRHLPLTALMLLPTLAWGMDAWARAWTRRHARAAATRPWLGRMPMHAALLALTLLVGYWTFSHREFFSYLERNLMLARGTAMQPVLCVRPPDLNLPARTSLADSGVFLIEPYPVQAVNFLELAGLPAPLWNGGNYAGYLIWRLSPERCKVFTDNRYDIYGGRFIREEHSVLNGWDEGWIARLREVNPQEAARWEPWTAVLKSYRVQTLFLPVEAPVNGKLAGAGWVRVWEDFSFAIWVRDTPANRPVIDKALRLPRPVPWIAILSR